MVRLSPHPPRSSLGNTVTERQHQTRSRANPGGMADVLTVLRATEAEVQPYRGRKPPWFKVPAPGGERYRQLQEMIESENLHTVCREAACPNIGECWQRGTATFMILGDTCTRRCGFCNVKTGKPTWNDPLEPARVARSVARMGLRHAVITSVDRDDLPDYGAARVRGGHPPDPPPVAGHQDRGAHAGLPRLGDAAGQGHRRAARRLQPQRRGGPAALSGGPPRLDVGALQAGPAQRQGVRRRRGDDQVRADGGPRRVLRGDGGRPGPAARQRRPGPHRRPVPAADRAPSADRALLASGRVRGAGDGRLRARLRPRGRRPAGALQLPRRPAHRPVGARASGRCGSPPHELGAVASPCSCWPRWRWR